MNTNIHDILGIPKKKFYKLTKEFTTENPKYDEIFKIIPTLDHDRLVSYINAYGNSSYIANINQLDKTNLLKMFYIDLLDLKISQDESYKEFISKNTPCDSLQISTPKDKPLSLVCSNIILNQHLEESTRNEINKVQSLFGYNARKYIEEKTFNFDINFIIKIISISIKVSALLGLDFLDYEKELKQLYITWLVPVTNPIIDKLAIRTKFRLLIKSAIENGFFKNQNENIRIEIENLFKMKIEDLIRCRNGCLHYLNNDDADDDDVSFYPEGNNCNNEDFDEVFAPILNRRK